MARVPQAHPPGHTSGRWGGHGQPTGGPDTGRAGRGIVGDAAVTVVAVRWIGVSALHLTYRTGDGRLDERLLYRDHEARLTLRQGAAAAACWVSQVAIESL